MSTVELKRPVVKDQASELIKTGRISSAVWFLAWPTIINTVFQTAHGIINRIFLGELESSRAAQAALGLGSMAPMIQFAMVYGISAGTSALVSRYLGAEEQENAEESTRQSLIFAVFAGILSTVLLVVAAQPFVRLLGAEGKVIEYAAGYTAIFGAASIPLCIMVIGTSALRAAGDVKTPLYTGGTVVLCNVIFDWLLIFGIGPFPEMGIYGAALATAISYVFGMVLILWFLRKSVLRRSLNRLRIHINWFWKLLGIGWPAIIQQLQFSISYSVYMLLIGMLDGATAIQAALTIGLAIESTSFMPGAAYNIAATPLVGQNLGAGQPKRAERCAWYAARHAVIIMSVVAIVFLAIPEYLARIFTQDESVVRLIVSYLRINAVCQPFLAIGMVMSGALLGAGDTRMPTWIEFATFYIIRLPLTWLLAIVFGWHASGAWSAMCISNVLYGILLTLWFMKGRWKYIQLH